MPYMHNGYAYFVRRPSKPTDIEIWSLYGEDGPKLVKHLKIPENWETFSYPTLNSQLVFHGDYILLANGETLEILDNYNPLDVTLVNRIRFPALSVPVHLSVSEYHIAALTRPSGLHPYATIVEYVEKDKYRQPTEWNVLVNEPARSYADLAVKENNIFMLDVFPQDSFKLNVFDITQPAGSNLASLLEMEHPVSYSYRMAANFPYLYIIEHSPSDGLIILDVSDPNNPHYISEIVLDTAAFFDLTVWENNLFLVSTTGTDDIWHFDISDPLSPQFVSRYPASYPDAITARDGFLFVLNDEMQIEITDLRLPENPKFVGTFDIENEAALDIFYHYGILWMALGHRGLAAVKLDLDRIP